MVGEHQRWIIYLLDLKHKQVKPKGLYKTQIRMVLWNKFQMCMITRKIIIYFYKDGGLYKCNNWTVKPDISISISLLILRYGHLLICLESVATLRILKKVHLARIYLQNIIVSMYSIYIWHTYLSSVLHKEWKYLNGWATIQR